ncbi:MAG: hypothetical protein HDT28_05140 [Clostridiales bacterium]|nr:hypothetical protein [Clostridiales bacterium]
MKQRIKSMSFWIGLIGSVILILSAFGVEIGDETANAVINGVCSLLVVFGIVTPVKQEDEQETDDATTKETDKDN